MSGRGVLALILVLVVGVGAWMALRDGSREIPEFTLRDLSGQVIRARDLRGQVVVLNLWATWCPPCVEEMPSLEALHRKMEGRDVVVLAVSQDERVEDVGPWVKERGLTLPVALDPFGEVAYALGVSGYPETFIIDREGTIVDHHIGYRDWSTPDVVSALDQLLRTGEWPLTSR